MLLAAVNESALVIAGADDGRVALAAAEAAIDTLLDRLVGQPALREQPAG